MSDITEQDGFNRQFLADLQASPTPFHATAHMVRLLADAGFSELKEGQPWSLEPGQGYYTTRNGSSLIAFVCGRRAASEQGLRMVGAHTDSPCLKVKPNPEVQRHGYWQLGVEVYGGALLAPWFDRDLSLAGRVSYRSDNGTVASALVDFVEPVAVVPSLAIHLDREANRNRSINPQKEMLPLLLQGAGSDEVDLRALLAARLREQNAGLGDVQILDYELSLYDTQPPALIGLNKDFLASARLDNLLSCYAGLQALVQADRDYGSLLVCNDHEEVGSASACGARGPMLAQFLERVWPDPAERMAVLERSVMVSADNAHAVHPNFSDRHDDNHGPRLNAGPVIKINANQRYASNSETSGLFRLLCEAAGVPVQAFVSRTDMECGSTIGPITATEVGVKTVDVGAPSFAMHSCRELTGSLDAWHLYRVLRAYYHYPHPPGRVEQIEEAQ